MPRATFQIPDEFRAFMREVVAHLESGEDRTTLLGPDAVSHECGRGGRIDGSDTFRFTYFARDGHGRWEIELREHEIHDVATGELDEVDAAELEPGTRTARGEPLIVWGEYDHDALRVRSEADLALVLDGLYALSTISDPVVLRLWSNADDQVIAVVNGDACALYVVTSAHGYGTSVGDPTRDDAFELVDHDAGRFEVPWSDCVPWRSARPALLQFAATGELGDHVILDGHLPSQLLALGDFDRAEELASRKAPPADPVESSLPSKTPFGMWAERLLDGLAELHLIEVDRGVTADVVARLSFLLQQFGTDAQDALDAAQWLAREIGRLHGVGAVYATAGDLQIALRRTQDPPTMPVDVPFE